MAGVEIELLSLTSRPRYYDKQHYLKNIQFAKNELRTKRKNSYHDDIAQNINLGVKQIKMDFIRFEPFSYIHYKRSKHIILNLNMISST